MTMLVGNATAWLQLWNCDRAPLTVLAALSPERGAERGRGGSKASVACHLCALPGTMDGRGRGNGETMPFERRKSTARDQTKRGQGGGGG